MLGGMKRRRILLLLALAAVVATAGLILFWPRGPKEPVFEGKRITVWVKEMMTQPVVFPNAHTTNALKATVTDCVPYFLHEFTTPRSKLRAVLNRWASAIPGVDFQFEEEVERITIAGWGLCILGPDAAPALPTLSRYLGDTDRGGWTALVMAAVGDQSLPWLLNAVASTNPLAGQQAMDGLVWMAKESQSERAFQALIALLRDTNSAVRMFAAVNLRQVVTRPDLTVQPLAAALADPDLGVQLQSALSLGEMGYIAHPAAPALLRTMSSTNAAVAAAASNAVFRIDPAALSARGP